jgi:hypothetical protein
MKSGFQPFAWLALTATLQVNAADISMDADDALGASSFDSGLHWIGGAAPAAGNSYHNANFLLRTPSTDIPAYTFGGDSLTITSDSALAANLTDALMFKGILTGNTVITVNHLTIDGGNLRHADNDDSTFTLAGNRLTVGPKGMGVHLQGPTIITAPVAGSGVIRIVDNGSSAAGRTLHFSHAANSFTGQVELPVADRSRFQLDAGANFKFVIGASGVNNAFSGAGVASFRGIFEFDLTAADQAVGASWTLVSATTLADSYDESTFSVAGFTADDRIAGSRSWTRFIDDSKSYRYQEATGVLSVVQADSDGDGLSDLWEDYYFGNRDGFATPEELELQSGFDDSDGDGANQLEEEAAGTDPTDENSWPDTDADGLKDSWEIYYFGNITSQGALDDPDGDLAANLHEFVSDTTPTDPTSWPDTDFDELNDAWEIAFFGANDLSKTGDLDSDGDSYTDREEHAAHTNPNDRALSPISAVLKNRWSFNGNLLDSVGGSTATVVGEGGNGISFNDPIAPTAITMTGGARDASNYISLGNNLLPKSITPVTLQLWAKQNAIQNWGRIFDFHSSTTEYLMMAWTRGVANASDQVEFVDAGVISNSPDRIQPYGITEEHHVVMTLEPLAGLSGRMKVTVYSAPASAADLGPAKVSFETAINLVNFHDQINALGYSPWAGDATASATYNEFRIWNGALVPYVRELLHDQGPDNATIVDSDNDFLADAWEMAYFTNLTAATTLGDADGDGVSDRDEYHAGSRPNQALSTPEDTDADGLLDTWEIDYFGNILAQDGMGDPDGDGFDNLTEQAEGTDPTISADSDGDGLSDVWEKLHFGHIAAQDGSGDPDEDGYDNEAEETAQSDPRNALSVPGDVDGDGLLDVWELTYFEDLAAEHGSGDADGDGFTNEAEETAKSNPIVASSVPGDINGDGVADGVLLAVGDPLGTASFNTATGWSDSLPPAAGKNYLVALEGLRTPADAEPYTFEGDRLVLTSGGSLIVKGTGVITIPHFNLDGGFINNATNTNGPITLEGQFLVTRTSNLWANNNSIIVNAVVGGNQNLEITRSGATNTVTFNAVNSFTGNLLVSGGLVLGSTGGLTFKLESGGGTNAVVGAGSAVFDGAFTIDFSAAGSTAGEQWTLVNASTLTESYGANFRVNGFTADGGLPGARQWTAAGFRFDEATGVLTRLAGGEDDSDSDGLSDAWELTWFGGLGQSASGDFDGDGTSNLTEFRLGLIPNDGRSRFAATAGAQGSLSWPSALGLTFTVERSLTLVGDSWEKIGTLPGTAGLATFTDPHPPAGKAFYRILLEP